MGGETMQAAIRRDRNIIIFGIAVITLLGWAYMLKMSPDSNPGMEMSMPMPSSTGWDVELLGMSIVMWCIMMIAMMIPSASPMILSFSKVHHQQRDNSSTLPTAIFISGYLSVWCGFSLIAAIGQVALHETAPLSSPMGKTGSLLGGGLLITAGLFQWSALKEACLNKCRTPLSFLLTEWREGNRGAFVMGFRHGIFCTGCCWALMLLMFVGGVINLAWMGALAVYMLVEKIVPQGRQFSRVTGSLLILMGAWMLVGTDHLPMMS